MSGIVDFHSHILPAMDDGSVSVEMSLEMLRREATHGIRKVVATPHFYADRDHPGEFLERRAAAEARLREAMETEADLPQLIMGTEVRFFPGISSSSWLSGLTIDEKKCMLIEMPEVSWTEKNYRELEMIHENWGIVPIIAHVDRYIGPFRNRGILKYLAECPVLVQANASFFLRPWTKGLAMNMLRKGQIHLLGSDSHNLAERAPNLGPALEQIRKRLGMDAISHIREYQRIIENKE